MSTEENKQVALAWFDLMMKGDIDGAYALMTDDFCHYVPGELPISGLHTDRVAYYNKIGEVMGNQLSGPISFEFGVITAEGDHVCVEAESEATTNTGQRYNGQYHFLFRLRDGKISLIKEYLDTQHIARMIESPYIQGPPKERTSNIF
ncbi:MAG: hypothetical protein JWN99_3202 [Ilumatobacteraceae bacterium]|nr:hypothetical protein [Ilumatobacteraceae bacterium]